MWPKKLIYQLFISYLLMLGIPIALITWYATDSFTRFYKTQIVEDLRARAYLIGSQVEEHVGDSSKTGLDSLCKFLAKNIPTRFTVISPSGKVIGDSEKNPDSMESHATRPEIIAALRGQTGIIERHSYTMSEEMMYVALPIYKSGSIAAVVRTSFPVSAVQNALYLLYGKIGIAVLLLAMLAAFISFIVSRNISRPIADMQSGTQRIAQGDFSIRLPQYGFDEANKLATGLNQMSKQLNERMQIITSQKNELDAVLSSMTEGVIAINSDERIVAMNGAAALLFSIDQKSAIGKWVSEVVRNLEVQDFMLATLKSSQPVECDLAIPLPMKDSNSSTSERFLQLHGSSLKTADQKTIGALMVINDITNIKKLENIRKDFVANVSHELRTPLTSVKGYVETLLNGAMDDPKDAKRFLGIVANQVDRLNTIVDDLLSLSRLEKDNDGMSGALDLVSGPLVKVLQDAVETCDHKAVQKNISISMECEPDIMARMDQSLLEQAVVNLLDNAVNYSDDNKKIEVKAALSQTSQEVVISVKDEGIGINNQHLERIFERFYRVDKARSRKLGGTGLGLSIVKHIALAHGGRVAVESVPWKGSTFYIYLPKV